MRYVLAAAALAATLGLALPASAQLGSTNATTDGAPGGTKTTDRTAHVVHSSEMVSDNPTDMNANKAMKKHKKAAVSGNGMDSSSSTSTGH